MFSERELRRYKRQIENTSIGLKGQEKLKKSKVLVVGAGRKGTSVLQNIAAIGIGKIGIADDYIIQEEDLAEQRLFGSDDIGKQKAIMAKQKLSELNHFAEYTVHNILLSKETIIPIFKLYDIIVDATNSYDSHCLIDEIAIKTNKSVVFGFLSKENFQVTVFNCKNGPSFKCMFPKEPKNIKYFTNFISPIGLLSSLTGTIMANEVLKIILDAEDILSGKILDFNINTYKINLLSLKRVEKNFN